VKLSQGRLIISAGLGGVLMGVTVAPINWWWLAWIALIPLWLVLRLSQSWLTIILSCLLWGIGYHGLALSWITGIHPMTWMGVSWLNSLLIAGVCWLLITGWGVILVAVWGCLLRFLFNLFKTNQFFFSPIVSKISCGVIIWCLLEQIWSCSPLWWTSLAYTQSPDNLAILQLLKISGVTTITALIVCVNLLFAEAIIYFGSAPNNYLNQHLIVHLISPITILFISHSFGYFYYSQPLHDQQNNQITIGIIQGNIPNEIKLYSSGLEQAIIRYSKGYRQLATLGVDLIITPETALPFYYQEIEDNSIFYQTILEQKTTVFLGAFAQVKQNFSNSLFLINGQGKLLAQYDKVNLVPLGEYIPFAKILGKFIERISPLKAHLIAGEQNQIINTPFGQAIVGICYDSAFPEHFRRQAAQGGELVISAANNAHYSASMPAQHHAQDVMRAIETDRWLARATNTGYSAIIDPHGNSLWLSDLNQYQIYHGIIYRRQGKTIYVLWGDWLLRVFWVLLILLIGTLLLTKLVFLF
jgi:apolipoprotein N-acyltransferase